MDDQMYEEQAKEKIKQLKQTFQLVPFQDDDFVFLDEDFGKSYLEQSVFMQNIHKQENLPYKQLQGEGSKARNGYEKAVRKTSLDKIIEEYDQVEEAQDRLKLLDSQFSDGKVWINFQLVENYQNQLNSLDWKQLLENKEYNFRNNKTLYDNIRLSVSMGLNDITKEARKAAWLLMLGIDQENEEIQNHRELYLMFLCQKTDAKSKQASVENFLFKDVTRTFGHLKLFNQAKDSGQNKLYNLLKVYSLYDEEIGYSQGMSFIAALILMVIEDEALAWIVYLKVLNLCEWRQLYLDQTPKLFDLTKQLRNFIRVQLPQFHKVLNEHNTILEPLFASPFLTLFANLIPMDQAYKVIDRFILFGERGIMDIMKHLLKQFSDMLVKMDCWDLQVHLGRKMYELAIESNTFFPPYNYQ